MKVARLVKWGGGVARRGPPHICKIELLQGFDVDDEDHYKNMYGYSYKPTRRRRKKVLFA